MEFNADMNSNHGTRLKKGESEMFKVLMILTLVIETVISQNFVVTRVSNFIANFVLKTDRQTNQPTDRQSGLMKLLPELKNSLTKKCLLGVLRKEMPPNPINMQSFGHQTFISSQPYLCF